EVRRLNTGLREAAKEKGVFVPRDRWECTNSDGGRVRARGVGALSPRHALGAGWVAIDLIRGVRFDRAAHAKHDLVERAAADVQPAVGTEAEPVGPAQPRVLQEGVQRTV